MAFRFSLAAVLRLKESIERHEELRLQSAESRRAKLVQQIEEMEGKIANEAGLREQSLRESLPAGHLQAMLRQVAAYALMKEDLVEMLCQVERQCEDLKKVYLRAHSQSETLASLRREQQKVFKDKQTKLEQKYLDDIFISRYHKK